MLKQGSVDHSKQGLKVAVELIKELSLPLAENEVLCSKLQTLMLENSVE